jgi:putative Holliday junction resolvase
MRIVGIDFGLARIGLAVSDPLKCVATPIGAIKAPKGKAAGAVLDALLKYSGEIELIVVGHPLELSGRPGKMATAAEVFAKELETTGSYPVRLWDERLSSAQVEKQLKEAGYSRKARAQQSDAAAASVILQSYLDTLA